MDEKPQSIKRLIDILDLLRQKCPWDKKQTMESLRPCTIEECFELNDALSNKDYDNVKEELGDVLLHIMFYAKIAQEESLFTFDDVVNGICDKLVYRHPHVFGDVEVADALQVSKNWELLKQKEKNKKRESILDGVPSGLPALIKAYRIGQKVSGIGFDWEDKNDVWNKVKEEIEEFEQEVKDGNKHNMDDEFGDVMFSLVNAARLYGINPENALESSNRKFIQRFNTMQLMAKESAVDISDLSTDAMELLWQRAKDKNK